MAVSQPGAGNFLHAVPSRQPFKLNSWAMSIAVQRRLGLPLGTALSSAMRFGRHGQRLDAFGDVALADGEGGHATRHAELLHVLRQVLAPVYGAQRVVKEPEDHLDYNAAHRPDLVIYGAGVGGVMLVLDLKIFGPVPSDLNTLCPRGERVAFGNTHPSAVAQVLGLEERGEVGEQWDASSGTGYVAPQRGDYAQAQAAGLTVAPLLFETFGGFGPETMLLLGHAAAHIHDRLTSAQYEETTWAARKWTPFAMQQISVALQRELAWALGRAHGLPVGGGFDPRAAAVSGG